MTDDSLDSEQYWFVGAVFGDQTDQTDRFLAEGYWENGDKDRYSGLVRSIQVGDHIAIKSTYTRKNSLPFDNRNSTVSVMAIKAIGIVTGNAGDGVRVNVKWETSPGAREWYFYTNRTAIWRISPGKWMADELIAFAFRGVPQDIGRFRNNPFWSERFGDPDSDQRRFAWTNFYEALADRLLEFRVNRNALLKGLRDIAARIDGLGYLTTDKYPGGGTGFVRDIDPFTVMGVFNRGTTNANRRVIAAELASFLGVTEPIPVTFEGVPLLNNLKSWFFPWETARAANQIDVLWRIFAACLGYERQDETSHIEFRQAFDDANGRPEVGWNLTMALYWCRPWSFPSLEQRSRSFITEKLIIPIELHGPHKRCNSADYFAILERLEARFEEPDYVVHSFPELSLEAWRYRPRETPSPETPEDSEVPPAIVEMEHPPAQTFEPYRLTDIQQDGCFLEAAELEAILQRFQSKKNIILQGPPGTGKTWLGRRLAYALVGRRDDSKVRSVQFHPSLSYEDFVRGWRPGGDGKLTLSDGVFLEVIKAAAADPVTPYVVVIEEINRGNPAQIFGELLTLLEATKRTPKDALELSYPDSDGVRRPVHIPANLYVLGTMNLADRSLALVDLALRRRFAFVTLEPRFGPRWQDWMVAKGGIALVDARQIENRISELNATIAADPNLGEQFRVGHSYVTPGEQLGAGQSQAWFRQVVETEIGPLLKEYWIDTPERAKKACDLLLQGW